jgi:alpha-glucosidase (family GH31 glycosyl hydrolase)
MREFIPRSYQRVQENGFTSKASNVSTEVALESTDADSKFLFIFQAVRPGLFRTTFSSKSHPLPPHPATPRPTIDFQGVKPTSESADNKHTITFGDVQASVDWSDAPVVSLRLAGQEKPIHKDLQFRSYAIDSTGIAHYTWYRRDTLHVGLGEKAAPMNLANRHFVLSVTDSFGYDCYRTDPLYKHIPLLINVTPEGCVAMFSTSHSRGTYAVGSEVSHYYDP